MRRAAALPLVFAMVLVLAMAPAAPAAARRFAGAGSFTPEFEVSGYVTGDVDGDGRDEIVVAGTAGEVRVWRGDDGGALTGPGGALTLPDPARSLLALVQLRPEDPGLTLLTLGPRGLMAYPASSGAAPAARGVELAKGARFLLRVGAPRFANIARDVNADGRIDVIVPSGGHCEIWLQSAGGTIATFTKAARVVVDLRRETRSRREALTDVLESAFYVPDLRFEDVNGDGRDDLIVRDGDLRAYHLQAADGRFPESPTVQVELDKFRDTTPAGDLRLGRTLAGGDRQTMESRDLTGDGIPDHVIAHRRKVWVFHGTSAGPQFQNPAAVLKVADDVTAVLLARIDDDDLPDLALIRIQVPSVAGLLRGLLAEWSVDIGAVGYANAGAKGFARTPAWRGELSVTLPAILGVMRDPDALIKRFEDAAGSFRQTLKGDLDGDGREDLALVGGAGEGPRQGRIDAWLGVAGSDDTAGVERVLSEVLFEGDGKDWVLDDVFDWIAGLGDEMAASATDGRDADAAADLRPRASHRQIGVQLARLDGQRAHAVVRYADRTTGRTVFDVLALR